MKASLIYNRLINLRANKTEQFEELTSSKNSFLLFSDSISNIDIPENSIDAIVTDPPYGSNVQYLELSHFWYVWNKDIYNQSEINFDKEAVSNRKRTLKVQRIHKYIMKTCC